MLTASETTRAQAAPQLFYRFEITRANGETVPVVISEDGLFLPAQECAAEFDHQVEAVLQH